LVCIDPLLGLYPSAQSDPAHSCAQNLIPTWPMFMPHGPSQALATSDSGKSSAAVTCGPLRTRMGCSAYVSQRGTPRAHTSVPADGYGATPDRKPALLLDAGRRRASAQQRGCAQAHCRCTAPAACLLHARRTSPGKAPAVRKDMLGREVAQRPPSSAALEVG